MSQPHCCMLSFSPTVACCHLSMSWETIGIKGRDKITVLMSKDKHSQTEISGCQEIASSRRVLWVFSLRSSSCRWGAVSCRTLLVTARAGCPFQWITRCQICTEQGVPVNSGNSPYADFHTPFQTIAAEASCTTACILCLFPPRVIVLIQAMYII